MQKQCIIWATDNNGQIANDEDATNNPIGPWTYANKTEKGNGRRLVKYCKKYNLCATNTHFIPHKKDKKYLVTWRNYEDGEHKQLDYIMISNKQKNWATQSRVEGTANPDSANQHQMLLLKIRIRIKIEQKNSNARHINFDIDALRDEPKRLLIKDDQVSILDTVTPGEARFNDQKKQMRYWNTTAWNTISTHLHMIQEKEFPIENKAPTKNQWG